MNNPYLDFVKSIEAGVAEAKGISIAEEAIPNTKPNSGGNGGTVLLFSPHPDDECITGLLPLRLMREAGKRIVNIPVTYGSNQERQLGRAAELEAACGFLGWEIFRGVEGFQSLEVSDVINILEKFQPEIVFVPHSKDWNSRHISTHFLVMDALKQMKNDFSCLVVETEYWGAMDAPNLMVEADAQLVADQVAAISLHVGEVARNPYHLLLPAWMQDNVRRGGELVGGQGGAVPDFSFATLYRLRRWENGELAQVQEGGKYVPLGADLAALFN